MNEPIQFRRVTENGVNKCAKCGHQIGVYVQWREEFRLRRADGHWSAWKRIDAMPMEYVEKQSVKVGPGMPQR